MAGHFDDFADQLQEEVMHEMAETFFGARKEIELLKSRLEEIVENLRGPLDDALDAGRCLHALLLDDEVAASFYAALETDPQPFLENLNYSNACLAVSEPFAFTSTGKYVKSLARSYAHFQEALDLYLRGTYYDDPDRPGQKRMTANLAQAKELAATINARIETMNTYQSPSCVLGYVRQMDPGEEERRKTTGSTLEGYACGLDKEMAITPVDFGAYGFPEFPELPRLSKAEKTITDFAKQIYSEQETAIKERLESINFASS